MKNIILQIQTAVSQVHAAARMDACIGFTKGLFLCQAPVLRQKYTEENLQPLMRNWVPNAYSASSLKLKPVKIQVKC